MHCRYALVCITYNCRLQRTHETKCKSIGELKHSRDKNNVVFVFVLIHGTEDGIQWRSQTEFMAFAWTPSPLPVFIYPIKSNNLVSARPNYFIFMGYLRKKNSKANPHIFIHMNPLSRNPGSAPGTLCILGEKMWTVYSRKGSIMFLIWI